MFVSVAAVLLGLTLPAVQDPALVQVPPSQVGAPVLPAPPAVPTPSPEEAAAVARVEAAGRGLEAAMNDLEPRAAAVRNDAAIPAADKETRIRAMIAEHQPAFDAFGDALAELIAFKAASEGADVEEAASVATMVRGVVINAITQALITGQAPEGMEDLGQMISGG